MERVAQSGEIANVLKLPAPAERPVRQMSLHQTTTG